MSVDIVPACVEHIPGILTNLRLHDSEMFKLCIGPEIILEVEIRSSTRSFTGFIDNEPACIWGLRIHSILNDSVYLWLLTTKLIEERPFIFVRHSQLIAKELLKDFSIIHGWVLKDNKLSIKWLRWLGCKLLEIPEEPKIFGFVLRRA